MALSRADLLKSWVYNVRQTLVWRLRVHREPKDTFDPNPQNIHDSNGLSNVTCQNGMSHSCMSSSARDAIRHAPIVASRHLIYLVPGLYSAFASRVSASSSFVLIGSGSTSNVVVFCTLAVSSLAVLNRRQDVIFCSKQKKDQTMHNQGQR